MTPRWFLKTITQVKFEGGYQITIQTDVPCHLWLYWTDKVPWVHRTSIIERGINVPWDSYWCYVVWTQIEQNEPFDTYIHTFTWTGWEHCQTKYFRFAGTIADITSPSDTPIYHKHYTWEPPSEHIVPPYEPYESISNAWWLLQPFLSPGNNAPTSLKIRLWMHAATTYPVEVFVEDAFIASGYIQFYPDQTSHKKAQGSIPAAELNAHIGQFFEYTVPLPDSLPLTKGQPYGVTRYNPQPSTAYVFSQRGTNAPSKLYTYNYAMSHGYTERNLFLSPLDTLRAAFELIF